MITDLDRHLVTEAKAAERREIASRGDARARATARRWLRRHGFGMA